MAEWPKTMVRLPKSRWWLEADDETEPAPPDLDVDVVEVVPADLARELYEALRLHPLDRRERELVARYEREIGK